MREVFYQQAEGEPAKVQKGRTILGATAKDMNPSPAGRLWEQSACGSVQSSKLQAGHNRRSAQVSKAAMDFIGMDLHEEKELRVRRAMDLNQNVPT